MKSYSLLLAGLLAAPLSAMAGMSAMDNAQLSQVSGQAYVIKYGLLKVSVRDLAERNVKLGPLDVSGQARDFEADHPRVANAAHQTVVKTANTTIGVNKTITKVAVSAIPGAGLILGPIVSLAPTPTVSFK